MTEGKKFGMRFATAVLGISMLAAAAGCATGSGAGLAMNMQVQGDFRSGQVLPDHRYYTTGPQSSPNAIVGVSKAYTLVSDRWAERQMTPELLRRLVGSMNTQFLQPTAGLFGADVLGPEGEQIGVWYSAVGLTTVIMLSESSVRIDPPITEAINRKRNPD